MINGAVDNPAMRRFELSIGDAIAAIYYRIDEGRLVLLHTDVPYELSGQGNGTRLAEAVFEELGRTGRQAIAKCPFLARFIARHREYAKLVAG